VKSKEMMIKDARMYLRSAKAGISEDGASLTFMEAMAAAKQAEQAAAELYRLAGRIEVEADIKRKKAIGSAADELKYIVAA